MERTYTYDPYFYKNKVVVVGYLMIGILLYSLYRLLFKGLSAIWGVAAIVSAYSLINTYLTKSNPREIVVSDAKITFRSFGEKSFDVDKLTLFRVRMITPNYQLLVRVSDGTTHGKFWVTYNYFNDKMDLLDEFNYLERKVHAGSLRLRGRDEMGVCRPHERAAEEAAAAQADAASGAAPTAAAENAGAEKPRE